MGVNLNFANLTNACLFDAILSESDKKLAADNGALFTKESFPKLKNLQAQQSLLNPKKITSNTDVNWNHPATIGLIESCEGTIVPVGLYDDDAVDETVFGNNSIRE